MLSLTLCLFERTASLYGPQLAGWSRLALGGLEAITLPGDHYSLLRPPYVELLAERLSATCDEASRHRNAAL